MPLRSRQGGPKQSRRWIRLKGARWTPPQSQQGEPTCREDRFVSRRRGEHLLSSGREGRNDSGTLAASGTDQGNGDDSPAVLSGRAAYELSSCGHLPPVEGDRSRGQSQCLQGDYVQRQRAIEDAMSAAV